MAMPEQKRSPAAARWLTGLVLLSVILLAGWIIGFSYLSLATAQTSTEKTETTGKTTGKQTAQQKNKKTQKRAGRRPNRKQKPTNKKTQQTKNK